MKNILYKLKYLTKNLEIKHLCIIDAKNILIDSALSFATLLGTNSESYFKTHHRRRLCPKRIDSRSSTGVEFSIHLFYRR
jgi:hypothetical protein